MTRNASVILAATLFLIVSGPPLRAQPAQPGASATDDARPGVVFANVLTLQATVVDVDRTARTVTLRTDDGREETIKCGPEVRNFDQIEKGDKVSAEYHEATAIFARKPEPAAGAPAAAASAPSAATYVTADRAALGQKPSGVVTQVIEVVATVEDIDYAKRQLALKGPAGRIRTIIAGDDVRNLESVKKGDEIVVRHTEALAIAVTK